jgi:hypothetical protein
MKKNVLLSLAIATVFACALPAGASAIPGPSISKAPAALTNSAAATFEFSAPGAITYSCSIDSAAPAICTSPYTTPGLSDGSHSFSVTGTTITTGPPFCFPDGLGGETCVPGAPIPVPTETTTVAFVVDTIAPVVSLTAGPSDRSASSKSANATFVFASGAGDKYSCTLDSQTVNPCSSPLKFKKLKAGVHKLSITPTDLAGNVGTPLTRVFAVNSKTKTFKFVGNKVKRCVKKKHAKPVCKKLKF